MTWFTVRAQANVADVAIEGEIRAGDARQFLAALPLSARRIALRITSPGGDPETALTMAAGLRGHPARVEVTIPHLAASAATLPVMAADWVEIAPDAAAMLHNPTLIPERSARPDSRMLRDAAGALERVKDRMLDCYGWRLKVSRSEVAKLMAETTWLDAEGAVRLGFADTVTSTALPMAACLDATALVRLGRVPPRFARLVAELRRPTLPRPSLNVAAYYADRERERLATLAASGWGAAVDQVNRECRS